ncbi:MAG TPA: diguanylate cyclase [Actinomycetota bacterium]|nr:diguanylate cyclase [Actinomycetota bacterium]
MSASRDRKLSVLAVGVDPGALEGCTLERAEDLLGALANLAGGGIDVVVTSLELPDATGTDVIASLRERAPDVPVIVVGDALAEPKDAFEAGASDVLPADAAADLVARAVRYAATLRNVEAGLRRFQAFDELTGLLNARGFELLANHHFRLADRSKHPVLIVFLRVDEGGESPGEAAVADAATVISSAVRLSDVAARVDSGAFCVLLPGAEPGSEPIVLERIIEAVASHNARTGHETGPSLSIGAAAYDPGHPVPLEELIAAADRRMRRPSGAPGSSGPPAP